MKTAGLILAAGESRRMGRPKALLDYRGENFLDRLIGMFAECCSPVVVVLGASADAIRAGSRRAASACFVVNEDWRAGQLSSMQCGLRALPEELDGVLFTLADHPAVQPQTLQVLIGGTARLRIPRYQGRRGHPVYWAAPLVGELLALAPGATARDVVQRHEHELEYIEVDDPGVLEDIDEPSDYDRLVHGAKR